MECCWYGCDRVRQSPNLLCKLLTTKVAPYAHVHHTHTCGVPTLLWACSCAGRGPRMRWAWGGSTPCPSMKLAAPFSQRFAPSVRARPLLAVSA